MTRLHHVLIAVAAAIGAPLGFAAADDGPSPRMLTRWGKQVTAENVWPEYPRPQLVRPQWTSLNGRWQFAVAREGDEPPVHKDLERSILVPFPVESALSGVQERHERVWYRRTFEIDPAWLGDEKRVLLHFGAVDWETKVWVNGKPVGTHRGGYDPFTFDITDALAAVGPQELIVGVFDPTDAGTQPRGKQVRQPEGIWYTPTTGIWQTVWIEPVSRVHLSHLRIRTHAASGRVHIEPELARSRGGFVVEAVLLAGGAEVGRASGDGELEIQVANPRLWSPDDPFLYDLKLTVRRGREPRTIVDECTSYVGIRSVEVGPDERGVTRILLNGKFVFQLGLLDQGFWPDGLYTPPSDEALRFDLETIRKLGFNMLRKHVKVEPARWYYWTDKLGILVWQDMPSGDRYIGGSDPDIQRTPESAEQFQAELAELLGDFNAFPSIILWVLYNEGWGQWDTPRMTDFIRQRDPDRLVDSASGWTDRGVGDVIDFHIYPGPGTPAPEARRAAVLGEFGGLGLPLEGHTWVEKNNWGYRSFTNLSELGAAYAGVMERLPWLVVEGGLSAAVYTQVSDVETEVNGLLTYDREVVKVEPQAATAVRARLRGPLPVVKRLAPDARTAPAEWRYTQAAPQGEWFRPEFDDRGWSVGKSGFGRDGTPGAVVGTQWHGSDIWLRRTVQLDAPADNLLLLVHHDEDVEVYVNGVLAAKATGYTINYEPLPMTAEGRGALRAGANLIAVHCKQTTGGQYIDLGIVSLDEP